MWGIAPSMDLKPYRCLFHITPVIPNRHFIPSSLLFFIHNSQLTTCPKWRLFSSGVTTQQLQETPPGIKQRLRRYQILENVYHQFSTYRVKIQSTRFPALSKLSSTNLIVFSSTMTFRPSVDTASLLAILLIRISFCSMRHSDGGGLLLKRYTACTTHDIKG